MFIHIPEDIFRLIIEYNTNLSLRLVCKKFSKFRYNVSYDMKTTHIPQIILKLFNIISLKTVMGSLPFLIL